MKTETKEYRFEVGEEGEENITEDESIVALDSMNIMCRCCERCESPDKKEPSPKDGMCPSRIIIRTRQKTAAYEIRLEWDEEN